MPWRLSGNLIQWNDKSLKLRNKKGQKVILVTVGLLFSMKLKVGVPLATLCTPNKQALTSRVDKWGEKRYQHE